MSSIVDFMPKRHNTVVILAYRDLALFEFGLALEIFARSRPEIPGEWYDCAVAAVDDGPTATIGGVRIAVDAGPELIGMAGTIVVPGWMPGRYDHPAAEAIAAAHRKGARIVSICTGAFLLAAAGLLDGRRATTHWLHIDRFERDFPAVQAVRDVLYVDEGDLLTSAGSAAGIDLCLHVVRRDFGAAVANVVARRLVVAAHRDGDQRQFVERAVPRDHEASRLGHLMDRLRADIDRPVSVDSMAAAAGMSRRTFIRRFKETTGLAPAAWVRRARIDRARELLEGSTAPIEEVARLSGFGHAAALRHHFGRQMGIAPLSYRRQFRRA
jgi:AraC family transcriptional regulator, transcriptional activator FtrA